LVNWKFERIVLPQQPSGILGPDRVGERVKVMKCPSTGEYVMYMHTDNTGYTDQRIGYATSAAINGVYEFHGALLYNGAELKKWDIGTFQDTGGEGYLLIHSGEIYRLSDDYRSVEAQAVTISGGGESPAMFKKDNLYYFLCSNKTSWERNDNFYYTAADIAGPWTRQGLFAPEGSLTHNSQTTFVFPFVQDSETVYMFMGDRWSFPRQASAATYVWMPLEVNDTALSIPEYWECWDVEKKQAAEVLQDGASVPRESLVLDEDDWTLTNDNQFASNVTGSVLEVPFTGIQAAIFGEANSHGGYANIKIRNIAGEEIYSSLVDFYCQYINKGLRYISPVLSHGDYTLVVEVTGEISQWTNKAGTIHYGSDDSFVTVSEIQYRADDNYTRPEPVLKTITGTVTCLGTPLGGASITISKGGKAFLGTTGPDGAYSVTDVPAGAGYNISVSKAGYETRSIINFTVLSGDAPDTADFDLLFEATVPVLDVIQNPSFESGSYQNDSNYLTPNSWTLDAVLTGAADVQLKSGGASQGTYRYYIWGEADSSLDFYQDITLPRGNYSLKVDLRPNTPSTTFVYVTIGDNRQKVESAGAWGTWGTTSIVFVVPNDNTAVRIGVEAAAAVMIDNVRLFATEAE
jgi:hypothetical protein